MLMITVTASAGMDITGEILPQMVELSTRIQCPIECKVNGKTVWAYPGDKIRDLRASWREAYLEGGAEHVFVRRLKSAAPHEAEPSL